MRTLMMVLVAAACSVGAIAQQNNPGYHLEGSVSLPVPVSGLKMTNLIFPVAVHPAVKVSPDILMQRPKGVENVVELKALRRNFPVTNITVYGADGFPYSFELHYVEDTAMLNFRVIRDGKDFPDHPVLLTGLPVDQVTLDSDAVELSGRKPFMRGSVSSGGVRLRLTGVYLRDSLLWLCLRVHNRAVIGFAPAYLRVFSRDRKRVKRTAEQDLVMTPVCPARLAPVVGGSMVNLAVGLKPFALTQGKRLVIELADSDGTVLELTMKGKILLRVRKG